MEGLLERLKNIEGKNEQQLQAIKNQEKTVRNNQKKSNYMQLVIKKE